MRVRDAGPASRRTARVAQAALLLAGAACVLLLAGCSWPKLGMSAELARRSEPLQAEPAMPVFRLLIVGDSTAVGTGASSGATSLAGLIARDHPDWAIANRGVDGAKFEDLPQQLPADGRFDAVLILCGGNDVLRLTGAERLRRGIATITVRSLERAPLVILMPPGNVGNAPALYPPLSWWMTQRAQALHAAVREVAAASGAVYIDLYQDKAQDPFAQDPDRMNAADGLHPSDAGYVLWYESLKAQAAFKVPGASRAGASPPGASPPGPPARTDEPRTARLGPRSP